MNEWMNEWKFIYLKSGITFINDKCKCTVNWINGHRDTLNVNNLSTTVVVTMIACINKSCFAHTRNPLKPQEKVFQSSNNEKGTDRPIKWKGLCEDKGICLALE